uniref:CCHC-type domain-containing protein n=1 Tax=Nothobranchius furzeri TaxID=105023 RepID=A0A8C6KTL9_NOTFU
MEYDDIVGVLQTHFAPKPLVIAERFQFHKRNQGEEETVAQYVAVLKRLSEHCEFGAYLEDALQDRFVCGLKCETVQKRLLTENDLTFRKAVDYAVSAETATREVQQLSGSLKVNAVLAQKGDKCRRCRKMSHTDEDCWYKDCDCHQCGRKGHTKRMCKGRARSSQDWNRKEKEGKPELKANAVKNRAKDKKRRIHQVAAEESESEGIRLDTDSEFELYSLSRKEKYSCISLLPVVNGKKMEMELDTGAAVSLIPWEQYKSRLSQLPLQPTDIMLKTYTGEPLAPEGVIKVQVELNEQRATLPLYVVKVDAPPLFGREWLRVIKLNWKDLKMIHASDNLTIWKLC